MRISKCARDSPGKQKNRLDVKDWEDKKKDNLIGSPTDKKKGNVQQREIQRED